MIIPEELSSVLASDPGILSGAIRFRGTRVPVQAMLDTIAGGESVDYFLDDYPDVSRGQAMTVLGWEHRRTRQLFGIDVQG